MDGYDEHLCRTLYIEPRPPVERPIVIDFQRSGDITRRQGSVGEEACPKTHFWCSDKDYCLPVFVRCNGVFDCPGHEDERDCVMYTCPGFYRCRASKMCVHVTHVCDGWPQCPQHDDELLCNRPCPLSCSCHGLAFFCSQVCAVHQFPDLRYLDARGSGTSVLQLGDNHMLIHLSLAKCNVKTLSNFTFYNLRSLDLTGNLLTEVYDYHFNFMPQVVVLFLADNPLTAAFTFTTRNISALHTLSILDLSYVKISVDTSLLGKFPKLHTLNLSHSGVELLQLNSTIADIPAIREIDLRGCATAGFPRDVLRGFVQLQLLHTDNFKLCCPSVLPPGFDLNHCYTTPDAVATCDHLLGSVVYRAMVGTLATLAMLSNVVSLTLRVWVIATWRLSSGDVVLTHLSVADLGMGLYLVTLALADRWMAGDYVWQDDSWREGAVCQWAGVLFVSCRHAATFFITILSLDRGLRHDRVSSPQVNPATVGKLCGLVWTFSLLLTAVPLMSNFRFLGQHRLCVPLLHKMTDSLESHYTYGLLVIVHIVLFVLCCVCEMVGRVRGTAVKTRTMNTASCLNDSQFVIVGSLASGFLYTVASLVHSDNHTDEQEAMHTILVYFGFTISCATNPFLYLYGVRAERSKQIKGMRLQMIVNRTLI